MRRAFICPLIFTAALIGAAVASPSFAQERDVPTVTTDRAVPDLSSIEQRLRDRGISEDRIGVSIARIRAAIASGNYPHLERRIYNYLHPDTDRPNADPARGRPDVERPDRERPDVDRPDVSRADDVRPSFDRPANTIAPVAPVVANARSRVTAAPGIARRN